MRKGKKGGEKSYEGERKKQGRRREIRWEEGRNKGEQKKRMNEKKEKIT